MFKSFIFDSDNISPAYTPVGIVFVKNGCCSDKPILITKNMFHGKANYSCQCACGTWCTTGHPTPTGALKDYQTMSNGGIPLNDNYD